MANLKIDLKKEQTNSMTERIKNEMKLLKNREKDVR